MGCLRVFKVRGRVVCSRCEVGGWAGVCVCVFDVCTCMKCEMGGWGARVSVGVGMYDV